LKYFSEHDAEDEFYNKQRLLTIRKHSKGVRAAARFIYLNRRAYGGMWRVNSKGLFNVPKSPDQKSPLWNKSIELCSDILQQASIQCSDYKSIAPKEGDFIFLDPPYYPLSSSSNFTGYTKEPWTQNSHEELMDFLENLNKKGVMFLMTNNRCDFIEAKAKSMGLNVTYKKVHRFIDAMSYRNGRKKKKRKKVEEVFVTNYERI